MKATLHIYEMSVATFAIAESTNVLRGERELGPSTLIPIGAACVAFMAIGRLIWMIASERKEARMVIDRLLEHNVECTKEHDLTKSRVDALEKLTVRMGHRADMHDTSMGHHKLEDGNK